MASMPCNVYRKAKTKASGFEQAGVVRGGDACFPKGMTLAELEPAIFGSEDQRCIFAQARGRLKFWADRPAGHVGSHAVISDWRATEDELRFAEGIRPRADLNCDRWIQSPEC
jgi:hypothetical protein